MNVYDLSWSAYTFNKYFWIVFNYSTIQNQWMYFCSYLALIYIFGGCFRIVDYMTTLRKMLNFVTISILICSVFFGNAGRINPYKSWDSVHTIHSYIEISLNVVGTGIHNISEHLYQKHIFCIFWVCWAAVKHEVYKTRKISNL